MASFDVNEAAVARARELIDARQYVVESSWADAQRSIAAHDLLQHLDAARA